MRSVVRQGLACAAAALLVGAVRAASSGIWTYETMAEGVVVGTVGGETPAVARTTQGVVEIPSTLGGRPVVGIAPRAFHGCVAITAVAVPSSVRSLGEAAFSGCSALTDVSLAEGVRELGDFLFLNCTGVRSVSLPASVAAVGWRAFYGCQALVAIDVAAENPAFRSVDGVLYDRSVKTLVACPAAKTAVTLPETLEAIADSAFAGCGRLCSLTVPARVSRLAAQPFLACPSLRTIDFLCPPPEGIDAAGRDIAPRAEIRYTPEQADFWRAVIAAQGWSDAGEFVSAPVEGMDIRFGPDGTTSVTMTAGGTTHDISAAFEKVAREGSAVVFTLNARAGATVSVAGEEIPVRPVLADDAAAQPLVAADGRLRLQVKTIPGLVYRLVRSDTPNGRYEAVASAGEAEAERTAVGSRTTLETKIRESAGFYRVEVDR